MLANLGNALDLGELVKRAVKYLVEGFMVAIAAYAIPKRSLNFDEVALISLTAAATFSILDTYVPTMAVSGFCSKATPSSTFRSVHSTLPY